VFQVILVRHGEVEGNSGPRPTFAGWTDKPLTSHGEAQARSVGERLAGERISLVWSSDLQRAHRTAQEIAAPHGLEVQAMPALREVNYGAWESLGHEEIHRDWAEHWAKRLADPLGVAPPEGENYAALWARLEPAWHEFLREADSATQQVRSDSTVLPSAVLVAHNGPLRLLLCHILGIPVENYRRLQTSNCGISRLKIDKPDAREIVVTCVNDTSHLHLI
jgi:broad specificity phosphatase PhoE